MIELNPLNLYMFMLDVFMQRDRDFFIMKDIEKSVVNVFGNILDTVYCRHIMGVFRIWCNQEGIDIK